MSSMPWIFGASEQEYCTVRMDLVVEACSLQELLALRKLQRPHKGIDVAKLNKGDTKKKRKAKIEEEEGEKYGFNPRNRMSMKKKSEGLDDEETKTRKLVRSNNFTQQTNALDVDKHIPKEEAPYDPHEELFRIEEKYRIKQKVAEEEGNVTNSATMLTAIPEVDLGMDVRLKNIEETEKAKRLVADERRAKLQRQQTQSNEPDLSTTRFFKPHVTLQSDAEALRLAKLEAQGLPIEPETKRHPRADRREMATDDQVMERFKKRMRK
ncbi:hypothetical protein BS47DRAFT_1374173 [Hydnum rufescens UP504]|uniref:Hepatocellular carcinoma-associated antigen 59 n=1 Tax=Hydnum rufescens UP504 TaxID=1448309 RepID=A0A9P6DPB1_9AGAM|nr:hypothetical protein BS47DRAFT_1374173 [Hydnum rufescens UP504]